MTRAIVIGLILITVVVLMFSIGVQPFFIFLLLMPFLFIFGMYRSRTSTQRKLNREARSLEKTFQNIILRDALVIDTHVWQNVAYQNFFNALTVILSRLDKIFILFDAQYIELLPGNPCTNSSATETSSNTGYVHRIINQFKEQNLIVFEHVQSSPDNTIDEQPPIIKVLACAAQKSHNVTFVSENRVLIARARSYLKKKKVGIVIIDDLESLVPQCDAYCNAITEGIVTVLPRYKG
jgi:hypothetical protein